MSQLLISIKTRDRNTGSIVTKILKYFAKQILIAKEIQYI